MQFIFERLINIITVMFNCSFGALNHANVKLNICSMVKIIFVQCKLLVDMYRVINPNSMVV